MAGVVVTRVVVVAGTEVDVIATVVEVASGEVVDDDEAGTVVDGETVVVTRTDEVSEAPSDPLLQPASAASIVAVEAAAFHALLMAAPPFGGC